MGVDASGEAAPADATLTSPELRADLVVRFGEQLAVVVEVQRAVDERKRWTWPHYEASARARHACDACVLVVATSDEVADWARLPTRIGPMNEFRAIVVGPRDVPAVTDVGLASTMPSLAVLAAIAHAKSPLGLPIARTALQVLPSLADDRNTVYLDAILRALDEAARRELEMSMDPSKYEYKSDFAKKYIAQGRAEGVAQGRAEGERTALYAVLGARGLTITAELRARIDACEDADTLRSWVTRAATASSLDEIF